MKLATLKTAGAEAVAFEAARRLGHAQAFSYVHAVSRVGLAVALREMRDSEGALEAAGFRNFSQFCESLGLNLSTGKELIYFLEDLGEDFLGVADQIGLSRKQLRALRAMPEAGRPEVKGNILVLGDYEYDLTAPGASKEIKAEFESIAKEHEKEKKKAERETASKEKDFDRQIEKLRKNYDTLAKEMIELGFTVEGKSHPSVELIKMASRNFTQGASQLRSALEAAEGSDARFFAQIVSGVCGAAERAVKLFEYVGADAANLLDED